MLRQRVARRKEIVTTSKEYARKGGTHCRYIVVPGLTEQEMIALVMLALVSPLQGHFTNEMCVRYLRDVRRAVTSLSKKGESWEVFARSMPFSFRNDGTYEESRVRIALTDDALRIERIHPAESAIFGAHAFQNW